MFFYLLFYHNNVFFFCYLFAGNCLPLRTKSLLRDQLVGGKRIILFITFLLSPPHTFLFFFFFITFIIIKCVRYKRREEFARLGFASCWRISTANKIYDLCDVYPKTIIIPSDVSFFSFFLSFP